MVFDNFVEKPIIVWNLLMYFFKAVFMLNLFS